jgi:hypothetical protein
LNLLSWHQLALIEAQAMQVAGEQSRAVIDDLIKPGIDRQERSFLPGQGGGLEIRSPNHGA